MSNVKLSANPADEWSNHHNYFIRVDLRASAVLFQNFWNLLILSDLILSVLD